MCIYVFMLPACPLSCCRVGAEYGFLSDFSKGFKVLKVLLEEYNK